MAELLELREKLSEAALVIEDATARAKAAGLPWVVEHLALAAVAIDLATAELTGNTPLASAPEHVARWRREIDEQRGRSAAARRDRASERQPLSAGTVES